MHRRMLIVRRFGELSFGLGYFEDGIWVDHGTALADGEFPLDGSDTNRAALDAIHAWFDCCGEPVAEIAIPVDAPVASARR